MARAFLFPKRGHVRSLYEVKGLQSDPAIRFHPPVEIIDEFLVKNRVAMAPGRFSGLISSFQARGTSSRLQLIEDRLSSTVHDPVH